MIGKKLRGWRLPAALVGLLVVAGGAYAAIPDASGTIHGCYRTSTDDQKGQLRVVEDAASCRSNETAIQWNEQGTPGLPGPAGADGADGADGVSPTVAQLTVGDPHCPAGGAALTDAAGTTAYVCNGAAGAAGPAGADGTPFDGTFTSPNGLYSVSVTDAGVRIASPDSSIRVDGGSIRVETMGADLIELRGANRIDVRAGTALDLRGSATATLEAPASVGIGGGGSVRIGGSGCVPAARVSDLVLGTADASGSVVAHVATGSNFVCIG